MRDLHLVGVRLPFITVIPFRLCIARPERAFPIQIHIDIRIDDCTATCTIIVEYDITIQLCRMLTIHVDIHIRIAARQDRILAIGYQITVHIQHAVTHGNESRIGMNRRILGIYVDCSTMIRICHVIILDMNPFRCLIPTAFRLDYSIFPIQIDRTMNKSQYTNSIFALGRNLDIGAGISGADLVIILGI